ncbi:chitin synthase-domain-containing protein [Zychaea mexicana]|uniref:chitin synthase-domain-containing protein n=1 Tax=Zychaea mexicana TaxID=64656 RepID=UPI0022FE3C97|nr:chitin synthase-domain-containing protein [Zychaea mexicana]KAI9487953.1 chitin synthase-domain-containing protein [Zychaea mexicana]
MDSSRIQSYTPTLNRNLSLHSETDDRPLPLSSSGTRPRRQKSLVRPERERIDENHRQYHYRQRATNRNNIEPSTTGSRPGAVATAAAGAIVTATVASTSQVGTASGGAVAGASAITPGYAAGPRKRYSSGRRGDGHHHAPVRRGQSILGRSEKYSRRSPDEDDDEGVVGAVDFTEESHRSFSARLWITYCRLLTCCIPNPLLRCMGIPNGPAQLAWREKIGLVSFILFVMGFVGFLTFGFTQVVCPTPPMSVHGGSVGQGYLVIRGWAFMLAEWNGHPPVQDQTSEPTNVLYPPIDAGGMDGSFLFQEINPPECTKVLPRKTSGLISLTAPQAPPQVYFPCQMFNPNDTTTKQLSHNLTSGCHLSPTARSMYSEFKINGVPRTDGSGIDKVGRVYYDWDNINSTDYLMVYNGDVLNLRLLQLLPVSSYDIKNSSLIASVLSDTAKYGGKDMTRAIAATRAANGTTWEDEAKCLSLLIKVGSVDTLSIGCMASEIVLYLSLVVILGVIFTRFSLAVIFGWFLSWRLGTFKEGSSYAARMQREAELEQWTRDINVAAPLAERPRIPPPPMPIKKRSLLPQTSRFTQPMPNSTRFDADRSPTPIWKTPSSTLEDYTTRRFSYFQTPTPSPSPSSRYLPATAAASLRRSSISSSELQSHSGGATTLAPSPVCPHPVSPNAIAQPPSDYMPFNYPLAHTICLVTCYSEGLDGVRTTLDSIATSDYPNSHKLILVVCDGIITGHGESMSTPDVCISMMHDFVVPPEQVEAASYIAIADGSKRNNMGKVYAGYYHYDDATVDPEHQQRVPMITIVKCGTPEEADERKPGNRGKRDSQIILMQFMQKVMFDERMTSMEYDFFNAIWRVTGIPADRYEIVLMVDADTKLFPDALSRLVSCAVKDPEISGLCGETRIANKTASWVSMIQVFEYYISHHQSKAFESIFGGVTCLPGCFCMYRIKAPKGPNGYWVPILANPDIVEHYSENVVDTLHKKNLLLLGEDRYLSTLMLRTFPNRKMMFVPQAACKTIVPDTFSVLLSQRRRWINSTIHNLMELVLVHDLCGTFCFSMQFVVFMELVGTLALPAAISFTLYLIILAILGKPAIIPLILLALILGLPAVLIVMTSRKLVYVGWMIIYLFSLPIWNFVLPTYAYWHFDDFSWGDTRKVEGSGGGDKHGHGDKEGEFDASRATMKKWSDYEKERRIRSAIDNNMPLPRFMEDRPRSYMDLYAETLQHNKLKRQGNHSGSESSNSDTPLQQQRGDYLDHPMSNMSLPSPQFMQQEGAPGGPRSPRPSPSSTSINTRRYSAQRTRPPQPPPHENA